MTSLREASGGRPIDHDRLLEAFTTRLEARTIALRGGRFDVADWTARQLTTGRTVRLALPDGTAVTVTALGVDAASGGLVVEDPVGGGRRADDPQRRGRPAPAGRRPGRPPRAGCNEMARAVFRKVTAEEGRRVVHLDRDRPLVEAALRDPARFDALYRKYLAQVYSYAYYELGHHHDAEDATERTFLLALGALPRFEERARPADGEGASTFRVWLFQIARNVVANARRDRRRHPETRLEAAATTVPVPHDLEGARESPRRGRRGLGRGRPPARRPASRARPAVRRGDVDRRDRRRPRSLRGRGPGPHPPRPAGRRPRPGRPRHDPDRPRRDRRSTPSSPTATWRRSSRPPIGAPPTRPAPPSSTPGSAPRHSDWPST